MFVGLDDFAEKVGDRLSKQPKPKTYSSRNCLHRRMLKLHPAFPDFVSGPKCGSGKFFFCRVCRRDVGMKAHGSGEFARHFQSDSHWFKDVTYRVHMNWQVLNRLMQPMELSANLLFSRVLTKKFCFVVSCRLIMMVSVTTLVEYSVHRLKSTLFEDWTADKVVLRKCIRRGFVDYSDYRDFLTDIIDLWPTIRPFIRCTGHPDAKEKEDTVSIGFISVPWLLSLLLLSFIVLYCFCFVDEGD